MPVVIDEIVITIEVPATAQKGGGSTTGQPSAAAAGAAGPVADRAAFIEECVEKVMELLRDRREP